MIGKFWELQQNRKQYGKQNVQWMMEYNMQKEQLYRAHQIEVADLRAAGLSPTLSAGGAGATTPILTPQPTQNLDYSVGNPLEELQSAYSINRTNEEAKAVRARTLLQGVETGARLELMKEQVRNMRMMRPYQQAQLNAQTRQQLASAGLTAAERAAIIHDLNLAVERQRTVRQRGLAADLIDGIDSLFNRDDRPQGNRPTSGASGQW